MNLYVVAGGDDGTGAIAGGFSANLLTLNLNGGGGSGDGAESGSATLTLSADHNTLTGTGTDTNGDTIDLEVNSRAIGMALAISRLWLFALVSLLPCSLQGEPLTFAQVLDRALVRSGYTGQRADEADRTAGVPKPENLGQSANRQSCPIHLEDYARIAAQFASANEMGVPPGALTVTPTPAESSSGAIQLRSRASVILCTALLYAKLEGIQAQQTVVRKQQEYVLRLIDVESRRVHAEVDHPLLLAQAKLLRARTRMEADALTASMRKSREALSALTGLPAIGWKPPKTPCLRCPTFAPPAPRTAKLFTRCWPIATLCSSITRRNI